MYLKRLELQGFKSFPDKIKLEFDKGITAVVGPNGSGKSNVSDAVRWVLGEQSAKSLRGGKMDDIIFSGTQTRRALGFAEVSLVIDNTDYQINSEYSEITVTRRLYRSGEGQSFINKTACRLKDIHELFMDTGVGREGYSIIGQGKIDEILNARNDDRRLFFEEAAGIVKFKNRKIDAENKLRQERENLIRLNDIMSEIESRLEPLSEQSQKARAYIDLAERQKLVNINIFLRETDSAESEINEISNNIANLRFQMNEVSEQAGQSKAQTAAIKADLAQITESIENRNNISNELTLDIEKSEHLIVLCEQKQRHFKDDEQRIHKEIANMSAIISQLDESKDAYKNRYSLVLTEHNEKTALLSYEQKNLEALSAKLAESEALIEAYNTKHIDSLRMTNDVDARLQRIQMQYEQLETRKETLDEERLENADKMKTEEKKLDLLLAESETINKALNYLDSQTEILANQKEEKQKQAALEKAELDKTLNQLREATSKHKLLSEMTDSYDGYYNSVKSILQAKKHNPDGFAGIHNAVAELLTVPKQYETAIETALGSSMQNIVTETENDAQSAIDYLKQKKAGRATFLPISSVRGREFINKDKLLSEPGIIGTAKELVRYDKVYEGIMTSLLGRVLVADNLDSAITLSKKHGYEYKIVTTEGDLVNPGGSLSGGSTNKTTTAILGRSREIAELKVSIDTLTTRKNEQYNRLLHEENIYANLSDQIEKNKMKRQENELLRVSLNANIAQSKGLLSQLAKNNDSYNNMEKKIMEEIIGLNLKKREYKQEKDLMDSEISDILKTMDEQRKKTEDDKTEKDKKIKEISKLQSSLSGLTENMTNTTENIKRINGDILKAATEQTRLKEQSDDILVKHEQLYSEIETHKEQIKLMSAQKTETAVLLAELQNKRVNLQNELERLEALGIEKIETAAKLENELTRLSLNKQQRESETKKWYDMMWDEYGLTRRSAMQFPRLEMTAAALQKEDKELKTAVRALGTVNVSAIDEYKELKERFEFLSTQYGDIKTAEEKLMGIIKELETLMEQQFSEQLAIISENFNIVFSEMFGGGTACLKLTDENDRLVSGIEIIAQPPGKKLQSMSLFSGGERALTAVALLFAILRIKPSPFCILDEVESALDDANVNRYASYLKNVANKTQFIIITHRKGTMEAADTLYGVTMQEMGVSKLIGVKLENVN